MKAVTDSHDTLSVRLAEMEAWVKKGNPLPVPDALDLIIVLRQYMAHAEEIERSVEKSLASLSHGV